MRVVEARNGQIIGMQDMGPPSWNKHPPVPGFWAMKRMGKSCRSVIKLGYNG